MGIIPPPKFIATPFLLFGKNGLNEKWLVFDRDKGILIEEPKRVKNNIKKVERGENPNL